MVVSVSLLDPMSWYLTLRTQIRINMVPFLSQLHCVAYFEDFKHLFFRSYCIFLHSWTKVYRFLFQRAVTLRWRGKSTICQFRNGNTSYLCKFVKYHRCRRNGHSPVPLNNEQRFKFAMSSYTLAAHHCDQRWTFVLTALRDSRSESNLQQFQLRQLSPRLTRFHGHFTFDTQCQISNTNSFTLPAIMSNWHV